MSKLKAAAIAILRFVATNVTDLLFTASVVSMAVGFWLAWQPLGLIVPGMLVGGLIVCGRLQSGGGKRND